VILTWVYRLIVALVLVLVALDFWEERDWRKQLVAVMVLVPLLLRLAMVK
jgi:hypothetical protein